MSPENPLTARVTVNRMWYELFGTGIVETTEDFGIMGQRPSHPELLDWLAVEFRESGWNIKHMYKLMVMSAAYRQSAKSTPEQLQKDPRNLLLSHGPRFRMDAEMLRDIALQSGGLLVNKIGGPSVKPYQPANVWEQVSYPTSDTRALRAGSRRQRSTGAACTPTGSAWLAAEHGCVRCAHARCGLHAPPAHRYAPAGSGDDERCAVD